MWQIIHILMKRWEQVMLRLKIIKSTWTKLTLLLLQRPIMINYFWKWETILNNCRFFEISTNIKIFLLLNFSQTLIEVTRKCQSSSKKTNHFQTTQLWFQQASISKSIFPLLSQNLKFKDLLFKFSQRH